MVDMEGLYILYLKHKALANNRGYRIPKDPSLSIEKMRQSNQRNYDCLKTLEGWFLTKWSNIDPELYIECAFKMFQNCTYINLLNPKVLKQYIINDKVKKFHEEVNKKTILQSFKAIKSFMKENSLTSLKEYCSLKDGHETVCLNHYNKGKIDSYSLVYMFLKSYVSYSLDEKERLSTLFDKISTYKLYVTKEWEYFNKMEKVLEG